MVRREQSLKLRCLYQLLVNMYIQFWECLIYYWDSLWDKKYIWHHVVKDNNRLNDKCNIKKGNNINAF
jgi:hypothetical protein